MTNFRKLTVEAWKIIWRSPYIWVISLAISLSSIIFAPLVIANTNNIARLCTLYLLAFLFVLGLNFFGLIGLIMIIHRLYRNEIVDFHHLLRAGRAIFKRMVRTLFAYMVIGFVVLTFCICLYATGLVIFMITTGSIPEGFPITLGPEFLYIMILGRLLSRVVGIYFGIVLCGMVIRNLGIWEGIWDGLTFIAKHLAVFFFLFIVSGAFDTLSIIIYYGNISTIQPGITNLGFTYSQSRSFFNNIFIVTLGTFAKSFITSLLTLAYLKIMNGSSVQYSDMDEVSA